MYRPLYQLPEVCREPSRILDLFGPGSETIQALCRRAIGKYAPVAGVDLEFTERVRYVETPTVLGISDGFLNISVAFDEGLPYFQELIARHPDIVYVGHAFTSADKFAFRQAGIEIPLEQIQDTIAWFFLSNSHLCKASGKVEDGDGVKRGKGYMNLWTFLSLYTDLPNYKELFSEQIPWGGQPPIDVWNYNGNDSVGPVLALPHVITQSKLRGVDKLYPLHRELLYVLREMTNYGVQIDRKYLHGDQEKGTVGLQGQFEQNKLDIEQLLPFNPKSNKASLAHFKAKGIELPDWQEATIREFAEDTGDEELLLCLDYKELGNGTDRWFAPVGKDKSGNWVGYMDENGRIHPRLGIFTSTSRMNCVAPNMQNNSKRRRDRKNCECGANINDHPTESCKEFRGVSIGKLVRRAVIASPGHYLIKSDYSNAEGRMFFHLGGHTIPREIDMHNLVVGMATLTEEMEFCIAHGGPREAAKTISHSSNYAEGLQLKSPQELRTLRVRQEIAAGARIVFPDWKFEDKIVTFTGANLAQRAFGDKSWKNRAKALEVAEKYFGGFPGVRNLQKKIMKQVETQKAVITPHGYYLLSFGSEKEDRCKTGLAMWGSNPVAHLTKLALVDLWRKFQAGRPLRPILQIHDEILCEVPLEIDPKTSLGWLRESMEIETPEIPGFILPVGNPAKGEIGSWGPNWSDMTAVRV